MSICEICPRNCGVDRDISSGYCKSSDNIKIARRALHYWEEPCISGEKGSGTVFFSGCNMGCVYCQNKEISHGGFGEEVSVERLAEIFLSLQSQGALNINLVTPTHFWPGIKKAVLLAKEKGLTLPIVCNTSCYEKPETIAGIADIIDIWLPDFKYIEKQPAARYSRAPDYPAFAKQALDIMVKNQPRPVFGEDGIMKKGVIVRHLVLPGQIKAAKEIIKYLYERYGDKIYISIMSQYTPCSDLSRYPEINRKITPAEYDEVVDFAVDLGLENGFIQEGEAASESFIPPFDLTGVK